MNAARLKLGILIAPLLVSGCLTGGTPGTGGPITPPPADPPPVVRGMAGSLAGSQVGKDLGRADLRLAIDAEYKALERTPAGQTVSWQGSSASGQVAPAPPYRVGSQNCRQYSHTILAGGSSQSARGTACRNPDGSWEPLT